MRTGQTIRVVLSAGALLGAGLPRVAQALAAELPVLWLGGAGELGRYEPVRRRQTRFRYQPAKPNSYPGSLALSLLPDPRTGILWVGTSRGLAALDPYANRFGQQHLPPANQPDGPETVQLVVQDAHRDSLYWVVTQQAGLWRWQRPRGQWAAGGAPGRGAWSAARCQNGCTGAAVGML